MLSPEDISVLRYAAAALTQRGSIAEAARIGTIIDREYQQQETEATVEWGVENRFGLSPQPNEEAARERLVNGSYQPRLVRRMVGPWEVAS